MLHPTSILLLYLDHCRRKQKHAFHPQCLLQTDQHSHDMGAIRTDVYVVLHIGGHFKGPWEPLHAKPIPLWYHDNGLILTVKHFL